MLEQEFSGFVEANGLRLYAERRGTGELLLYISGTGADLRNKPNQFDSPFGHHFDLVSFDQRGLGQSENPRVNTPWRTTLMMPRQYWI